MDSILEAAAAAGVFMLLVGFVVGMVFVFGLAVSYSAWFWIPAIAMVFIALTAFFAFMDA